MGKIDDRRRVKRPDVDEMILTTGARVSDNDNWYEYWPRKNGTAKRNAVLRKVKRICF